METVRLAAGSSPTDAPAAHVCGAGNCCDAGTGGNKRPWSPPPRARVPPSPPPLLARRLGDWLRRRRSGRSTLRRVVAAKLPSSPGVRERPASEAMTGRGCPSSVPAVLWSASAQLGDWAASKRWRTLCCPDCECVRVHAATD